MRSKPRRRKAWPAGPGGPTLGKCSGKSQKEPLLKQKVGAREDSSRVDLGKERIDKTAVTVGGLGKVDDLLKGIDEVESRDSIKP